MLIEFFSPYVRFFHGAAYSLHQTLDGLGLSSTGFIEKTADGSLVGGFAPGQAVLPALAALILLSLCAIPGVLFAGYILGRKKGLAFVALALLAPGFLSVSGVLPDFNLTPSKYNVGGTGSLGSAFGFMPLTVLGVIFGWCLTVILYDTFKLNDRFRHFYDHIWFLAAILTGIFFVADSGSHEDSQELAESSYTSRNASLYLLRQVREYDAYCLESGLTNLASCRWASRVQQQLNDYAAYHHKSYKEFGPHTSRDIYVPTWGHISDEDIIQIRKEIQSYNNKRCPVEQLREGVSRSTAASGFCQQVPAAYCAAFPDPPTGLVDKYIISKTVALASECIVPSLVVFRAQQEKLISTIGNNETDKHYRWLFFIIFSTVVGGKIANSTTRIVDMDNRPGTERQILMSLLYWLVKRIYAGISLVWRLLAWAYYSIRRQSQS
ncbi:hypothetical protein [Pseudomonas sp. GM17]|uniref:hypothetical protein n=1 Tax=Pseudomonas sp. GM17 TaxID=1144323 RepID=UPI00027249F7|nr:hypothetical protein [Pseudomonas sp. GM17]WIE50659.1 hypothetical protein PMI20_003305 [Pseudomonas sp. GM17]